MTSDADGVSGTDREHVLRAVMFVAGHSRSLLWGRAASAYSQLEGVVELFDLANSYVLNDITAVGGTPEAPTWDEFTAILRQEGAVGDAIEIIGQGPTGSPLMADRRVQRTHDLTPFMAGLGIPALERAMEEIDAAKDEIDLKEARRKKALYAKRDELFERANVLLAQSYILVADKLEATYIPERRFGARALQEYPQVLDRNPHVAVDAFRQRLGERLAHTPQPASLYTSRLAVPSFLSEALRNAETPQGIFSALRDLRYSAAASRYRDLVRVLTDPRRRDEQCREAERELHEASESAFRRDGLKSRIPRWIHFTAALSAAAVKVLYPEAGPWPSVLPAATQTMDQIDMWLRRRASVFEFYARSAETDLYAELRRVFKDLNFGPEHLAHFLRERDFGWTDESERRLWFYWFGYGDGPDVRDGGDAS